MEATEKQSNRERLVEEIESLVAIYSPIEDAPEDSAGAIGEDWSSRFCRPRRAAMHVIITAPLDDAKQEKKKSKRKAPRKRQRKKSNEDFFAHSFLIEPCHHEESGSFSRDLVEPLRVEIFAGFLYPSAAAPSVRLEAPWLLACSPKASALLPSGAPDLKTGDDHNFLEPKWTAETACQKLKGIFGWSLTALSPQLILFH